MKNAILKFKNWKYLSPHQYFFIYKLWWTENSFQINIPKLFFIEELFSEFENWIIVDLVVKSWVWTDFSRFMLNNSRLADFDINFFSLNMHKSRRSIERIDLWSSEKNRSTWIH